MNLPAIAEIGDYRINDQRPAPGHEYCWEVLSSEQEGIRVYVCGTCATEPEARDQAIAASNQILANYTTPKEHQ